MTFVQAAFVTRKTLIFYLSTNIGTNNWARPDRRSQLRGKVFSPATTGKFFPPEKSLLADKIKFRMCSAIKVASKVAGAILLRRWEFVKEISRKNAKKCSSGFGVRGFRNLCPFGPFGPFGLFCPLSFQALNPEP